MREILYINKDRYNNILLVFPTVALLKENANEMTRFVREKELDYKIINSIRSTIDEAEKHIFVFTPERVLQLLATCPNIKIDFFFYDEIYKIDEDYCYDETDEKSEEEIKKKKSALDEARGKTFRIALYLLSKSVNEYYLAGPNLNTESFGSGMKKYINSNKISVTEIKFEPTVRISVEAWAGKVKEDYYLLPETTTTALTVRKTKKDQIVSLANYIENKQYGHTLLYCSTPANASLYAQLL